MNSTVFDRQQIVPKRNNLLNGTFYPEALFPHDLYRVLYHRDLSLTVSPASHSLPSLLFSLILILKIYHHRICSQNVSKHHSKLLALSQIKIRIQVISCHTHHTHRLELLLYEHLKINITIRSMKR